MSAVLLALLVAAGSLVVGAKLARKRPKKSDPRMALRPGEPIAIARAPVAGVVACEGVVVACERAVRSPTASNLVWYECVVEAGFEDSENGTTAPSPLLALVESTPFEIEDGSGKRLRVLPARGTLLPDVMDRPRVRADGVLRARLFDLLVAHNKATDTRATLFYAETSIAPGDRVVARGAIRRGATIEPAYRTAPQSPTLSAEGADLEVWRRKPPTRKRRLSGTSR